MSSQVWTDILADSFKNLGEGVLNFAPKFIIALIVFIVGMVIAGVIGRFVASIINALKVDGALQSMGIGDILSKAGFRLDSGVFIGGLVKWFLAIVFLMASIDILGLSEVNRFLKDDVLSYLPDVIIAVLILVAGALVAGAMQKIVVGSAKAANVPSTHFLGGITKWSIWIFAILAALYQLGIAGAFAQTIFTGFMAMIAIAGGLAFGLGGKDAAAHYIEKLRKDIKGE
mgnify:CR=1 FL=1